MYGYSRASGYGLGAAMSLRHVRFNKISPPPNQILGAPLLKGQAVPGSKSILRYQQKNS